MAERRNTGTIQAIGLGGAFVSQSSATSAPKPERRCAKRGCDTILSKYNVNKDGMCATHATPFVRIIDVQSPDAKRGNRKYAPR